MADRTPIHANHLENLYRTFEQEFPVVDSKTIYGEVLINQERYLCKGLTFEDCEIDGAIKFEHLDLQLGVRFINCVFKGEVVFNGVKASGIKEGFNGDNNSICFKNCSHAKSLCITKSKLERAFRLDGQQSLASLKISTLEAHSVALFECKLGGIDVEFLHTEIGFRIEKSEVSGQGRYFGCEGAGFTFMGSTFARDQSLWANVVQSITTNDGVFEEEFKLKACPAGSYTFYGTEFKKAVNIVMLDKGNHIDAVAGSIDLRNCNFQGGFIFTGNRQLIDGLSNCGKLSIGCSNLLAGNIIFENTVIAELDINGTNVTASLSFNNCAFQTVHIDRFINQGKLYFADIEAFDREGSVFSVAKTTLGASVFLNVDLLHFEKVIIKHSHLTDIIFTDIKWFKPGQLNPLATFQDKVTVDLDKDFKKKNIKVRDWALLKTNREVYRQLKYTALRLGDAVQSLVFQAEEMKLYKQELEFYRINRRYAGNKAMMWLNQSNNYGNDWIKPVGLLLLLNLAFYAFITLLQSEQFDLLPSCKQADVAAAWALLRSHFDAYWFLLNPVRRLTDLYPDQKKFSAWTVFWDYFDRITVSYFIFQIVSAFRKYTR